MSLLDLESPKLIFGFAIVLAVVAVLVLAYFGLFNTIVDHPEPCSLHDGIQCEEFELFMLGTSSYEFNLKLLNARGQDINLTNITIFSDEFATNCYAIHAQNGMFISQENPYRFNQGELSSFWFSSGEGLPCKIDEGAELKEGANYLFDIKLKYQDLSSFFYYTVNGEVLVKAE